MTIREIKFQAIKKLRRSSGPEAAIDAEILLAHALRISREELLTHDERIVPAFALKKFRAFIDRRAGHEPVAYTTGHKEFFGLQFFVNRHTLIPRPETEMMVEEALKIISGYKIPPSSSFSKSGLNISPPLAKGKARRVLVFDVGTGSGAIAIAIAANAANAAVIATDISKPALKLAERNAVANNVADRVIFERADLLGRKNRRPPIFAAFVITANLPYLPTKVWKKCAPDVKKFEPRTALDGGEDGLRYYDQLFHQIVGLNIKATIICEIDPSQKISFPKLVERHFPNAEVEIKNDLAGLPRMAIIYKHREQNSKIF